MPLELYLSADAVVKFGDLEVVCGDSVVAGIYAPHPDEEDVVGADLRALDDAGVGALLHACPLAVGLGRGLRVRLNTNLIYDIFSLTLEMKRSGSDPNESWITLIAKFCLKGSRKYISEIVIW